MTPLAFVNAVNIGTVVVRDRVIAAVGGPVPGDARVIDCTGRHLAPGLIDAGVFAADAAACVRGGITRVVLMPDRTPPLDDPALIEFARATLKPDVWVHPLAAATRSLLGTELAEIGLCRAAGAAGCATGRRGIADTGVMYRLMQYASGFDMVVVSHAEDAALAGEAVATEGEHATRLGLAAAPAFAESVGLARDLRLAEATGCRLHVRQVTTAESVALVRDARARGVRVTCGVTPAHLLLNDQAVSGYRTFFRMSPPLRCEDDRRAVLAGVADGTIDVIASGHDPRSQEAKRLPFADAEPGATGAETLLALALVLAHDGTTTIARVLDALTAAPARIFELPGGAIVAGGPADLALIDIGSPWRIDASTSVASAANTPFDGMAVQGRVVLTVKGGDIVWSA